MQVTGLSDAQAAAEAVLSRPGSATEWCVVKQGGEGAVLVTKAGEVYHAPAFKVSRTGHEKWARRGQPSGRQHQGRHLVHSS